MTKTINRSALLKSQPRLINFKAIYSRTQAVIKVTSTIFCRLNCLSINITSRINLKDLLVKLTYNPMLSLATHRQTFRIISSKILLDQSEPFPQKESSTSQITVQRWQ